MEGCNLGIGYEMEGIEAVELILWFCFDTKCKRLLNFD